MTKRERLAFGLIFFGVLGIYAVSWAITANQIWNNVYDSANSALRLNVVAHI